MSEFTPGPWVVDGVDIRAASAHETDTICGMASGYREADANLIAAAPDLLDALDLSLSALSRCAADEGYSALQAKAARKAKAAIAKARGEA